MNKDIDEDATFIAAMQKEIARLELTRNQSEPVTTQHKQHHDKLISRNEFTGYFT